MFDSRQTDIIRQALIECDRCETLALTGVPIEHQFTEEFEKKAEALKRRVALKMKATLKRLLIAAVIVVLILATTVAIVAGQDGMKAVQFGNSIDRTEREIITDLPFPNKNERVLDISALMIEADLPIPKGYECTYFDPYNSSYTIMYYKESESAAYGMAHLNINIYEVYPDSHIKIEHNGEMLVLETGDLNVYHYDTEYMTKGDNYVARISTNDRDLDDSQVLEIFDAIDKMLHAPMRTEEEIRAESKYEPNPEVHTGWTEMSDIADYNLDFSRIEYKWLPVPEGYDLKKVEGHVRATYQKSTENGWGMISEMIIEMIDLTTDPYIHSLYENNGDPITVGDITLNYRAAGSAAGFVDDRYSAVAEYVYVTEEYAVVFTLRISSQYSEEELPSPEELALIVEEISKCNIAKKN